MDGAREYLSQRIVPDATYRNWNSYSANTSFDKGVNVMEAFNLLPDPQTNGGILFTCPPSAQESIEKLLAGEGLQEFALPVGRMVTATEKRVRVMKED
jgi:selenide,water dikinase